MAVTSTAHAALKTMLIQKSLPFMARVLATLIRMSQHHVLWRSMPNRHQQGIKHQLLCDSGLQAREQVNYHGQIEPAFMAKDIGYISTHA